MKRIIASLLVGAVLLAGLPFATFAAEEKRDTASPDVYAEFIPDDYKAYLDFYGYKGQTVAEEISVDIGNFVTDGIKVEKNDDYIRTDELGTITWNFDVIKSGFYNVKVGYCPDEEGNAEIIRSVLIDGKIPYEGLKQQIFPRCFDNNTATPQMIDGNELRSEAVEIYEFSEEYLRDSESKGVSPYVIYLTQGAHTITFETKKEPLLKLKSIVFCSAEDVSDYSEVKDEYKSRAYSGKPVTYQAERCDDITLAIYKSSASIEAITDYTSAYTVPYHPYLTRLNTMGGNRWQTPGETVTWKINVEQAGTYAISLRSRQSANRDLVSYRSIKINGATPYTEAKNIGFTYSADFKNNVLKIGDETLLFDFKEGENTVSMEVVTGSLSKPVSEVSASLDALNSLYRQVVQITGVSPDKFVDYDICDKIDGFADAVGAEAKRLYGVVDYMMALTGEKGSLTALLEKTAIQAEDISENPEDVINQLSTWKNNISSLGNWIIQIEGMPLEVDSITLFAADGDDKLSKAEPNFFIRFYYGVIRFFASFVTEYVDDSNDENNGVTVWITSGRDQVNILKSLVSSDFADEGSANVSVQLVPADVVLPAALSGNGPDVVVNMPYTSVVDYAMRNAVVDMSKLDGFKETAAKYQSGAINTVSYQGGIYGMPETQMFPVMFCRDDILGELGLKAPDTWIEFEQVLSELNSANYDVYVAGTALYPSLVFQYGGNLYRGEGNDYGIASGLDSDAAMTAFKQLTKLFTTYSIPVVSDFANRFRTGEMPVGIADYTIYNTLELFAPEIKGLWSIYELPGVVHEDGTVDRSSVSTTTATIILSDTDNLEGAWDFVQWWHAEKIQLSYARQLEALLGASGRYATASVDVARQLNWETASFNELEKQFKNSVATPMVPGHYMTTRMISNAFNEVVTSENSISPREALYLKIATINEELTKKRNEFGLSVKEK